MIPSTVLEIAGTVRGEVRRWTRTESCVERKTLAGACAIGSYTLWRCLRELGYRATFVCHFNGNRGHCFVEMRGHVLDITATQFGGPEIAIFQIGCKPLWLFDPHYYPGHRYENRRALEIVHEWGEQSPAGYEKQISALVNRQTDPSMGDYA